MTVPEGLSSARMSHESFPAADVLDDSAVYQRTSLGQRELLRADDIGASPMHRLLARVNGFTELRSLVECAPAQGAEFAQAVHSLVERGLIELVAAPAPSPASVPAERRFAP